MILVAGSSNLDFVVRAAHIPAPGETVLGRGFATYPGGKGANQALACARAGGAPTRFLTAMGDDAFAQPLQASLRDAGVALDLVRVPGTPTGVAFICVADSAENAITVAPGANATLAPEHLPSLQGVHTLLMQLEVPLPTVQAYARCARAEGVRVVLNAAPMQALAPALLDCVDVLVLNEGELAALGPQGTLTQRMRRTGVASVVVTLGARGCCALHQGAFWLQPAYEVVAVDTTAAGDTFCGALVAAWHQDADFGSALQRASAAAALACTRPGAQTSIPHAAEVQQLIDQHCVPFSAVQTLGNYCGLQRTGQTWEAAA